MWAGAGARTTEYPKGRVRIKHTNMRNMIEKREYDRQYYHLKKKLSQNNTL